MKVGTKSDARFSQLDSAALDSEDKAIVSG